MGVRSTRLTTDTIGYYNDSEWNSNGTGSINQDLGSGDSDYQFRDDVGATTRRRSWNMTGLPKGVSSVKQLRAQWRIRYSVAAGQLDLFMRYNSVNETITSDTGHTTSFVNQPEDAVADAPSSTPWTKAVAESTEMGVAGNPAGASDGSTNEVADITWNFDWRTATGVGVLDVFPGAPPILLPLLGSSLLTRDLVDVNAWLRRWSFRRTRSATWYHDLRELEVDLRAMAPVGHAFL